MKKIISIILILLAISCQSEAEGNSFLENPEKLSLEDATFLENMPEAKGFNDSTVVLPNHMILRDFMKEVDPDFYEKWKTNKSNKPAKTSNSANSGNLYENLGPQDAHNLINARMTMVALNLMDRTLYQKNNEGDNKPSQNGLAYLWGSSNYKIRQLPRPISDSFCRDQLYGLDCSGFVYQLFKNAEIILPEHPANDQRNNKILESALKQAIPSFEKIKIEEFPHSNKFEQGDIIYWLNEQKKAYHIGLILKDKNNRLAVCQSNGTPGYDAVDCQKNISTVRGPRILELTDPYWFSKKSPYVIIRINAGNMSKWRFTLKCAQVDFDFFSYDFEFPTNKTGSFVIEKSVPYPNSSIYNMTFNFNYNKETNVLSCEFKTATPIQPTFSRSDSFAQELNRDHIDYFNANQNYTTVEGVCTWAVKLVSIK